MHCKHSNTIVWSYHMLQHWDGCSKVPDNYQLDQNDRQVLCISKQEFDGVLKKHKATGTQKQQWLRSLKAQFRKSSTFAAAFWGSLQ
jgi:hypothetical protein